ncbi:SPla/RYanodine receptor SPRY [Penicillium macrosclerotiorum]|uniref:SPla/RYanodine receptor SPRY n=1 Tax=Penicillium macrosclerotiorum TaxID=303699 RepID=UPI00254935D7|nr:SPla/RYanodine receptor SPRY [Penicillium macrosclerotiorum]KAJ5698200.1 SPla/RYanodine receptor SPRY [Penicillium macrosclerotiorum]
MADVPFPGGARGAPTPTYGISSAPRRSSYASVVSGTAFSPPISNSFSHLLNSNPVSSYPPLSQPDGRLHRALSGLDAADMHLNSAWRPTASSDPLPAYSRKYASYPRASDFPSSLALVDGPSFFTPSYLRHSRYISRLDAAHRAKLAAQQRDASSSSTSASNPPLSASSSNVHLPRMAPSHRGMTYEIIEKEPPSSSSTAPDQLGPLPSQWSSSDKYSGLELSNDGLDVRYTGPVHKHDHEAAALRADHPMPPQCGIYYYEIKIESKPKEGMIGIGFSSTKASVERLPGWEQESWAYHGDDGKSFFGESQGQGRTYGPTFGAGDTVGCGVNFAAGSAFFTKNGTFLGNAFHDLRTVTLYPSEPFVFDIDGMVQQERAKIQAEINNTSTDSLQPPLGESALLQELVAQFLAHDGYVETARAFAGEVATETAALQSGHQDPLKKYEVEEDREAINRNKIRAAILDGDIDKALKHTKAYYANVLEDHPQIHFKLRCRKFLEMMRRSNELSAATAAAASKRRRSVSPRISDEHAVFDQEMELDGDGWDGMGMDTEQPEAAAQFNELLTEAVQYGQQLRMDYPSDANGGDIKMLDDIFSLVAYPDPMRSVHGHYLDPAGRVAVAEELNSAILVSLGKSSSAALERLYRQTEVLVNEISEDGGAGAFINVRNDILL